ncbi:cytochrome b/b6 domain-containing protein [Thermodesulfitimonas autotrophica]|uniref:cytochrome b/b6 domain-containing protein n=1 Tax=Thermodesulfitimonas autotrophica TaxID=1894989 RepID=UPI002FDF6A78
MIQLRHPLPARIFHWTLAPLAITLVATGLYLTNPPYHGSPRTARKLHSLAGFLFTGGFVARLYYAALRREWRLILPERHDLKKLPSFARYHLYLTDKKPQFRKYNIGQKFLYTFWPLEAIFALPLGFFLYAPHTFARPVKWLGGLARIRQLLYSLTLLTAATMAGHIYLALTDSVGKLKSIFTGYYKRGT